MNVEVAQFQTLRPVSFVQVHEHRLLEFRFPVVDGDGIIMPVQAVNEGLDGRFVDVADVGSRLARLTARHNCVRIDQAESVDDDLSFH